MKILTLSQSDSKGGAAIAMYRIYSGLRNIDVDVKLLVKYKSLADPGIFESSWFNSSGALKPIKDYIQIIKRKMWKRQWKKYPDREAVFMSDLNSIPLNKAINSIKFDILHLHWISHEFLNINELAMLDKPIVWTLHDCWPFTGGCHYFYECKKYMRECGSCPQLKSTDDFDLTRKIWKKKNKVYSNCNLHIVSPSKWLASCAKESSLFSRFPVTVIPNGIDTRVFTPVQKEAAKLILGLKQNKKYILFGAVKATNDKRKGFHLLQESLKILKERMTEEIELLIFGSGNQKEEYIYGFRSHYIGILNDDISLMSLYNAAEVAIVPSLSENLSNVIMESIACGTPVVAFNVGGNSDMIDHKQNGYLAKPNDFVDLAEGIKWCLENNADGILNRNAREKAINNYSIEMIAGQYKKLYEAIQVKL